MRTLTEAAESQGAGAVTKAQTWNRIALAFAHSILNVASIAAFMPIPRLAAYAAAKAYVLSLTESLSRELSGTGVTATALCPGLTDTAMRTWGTVAPEGLTAASVVIASPSPV